MKSKTVDDYYLWSCGCCDTENFVLWEKLQSGIFCRDCHHPLSLPDTHGQVVNSAIDAGWCQPCFSY
ncbi:MAG: hypothetical protein Q7U44_01465 [Desulfuromonadales bacterium]|nr:hypothetical protein [Desulfuromonadales bacterium]